MTDGQTPESFDIEAWIAESSRPTTSVPVSQRGDLLGQMDILAHKIRRAETIEGIAGPDIEKTMEDTDDVEMYRHQYKSLADAYEASTLMLTFQALDSNEWREVLQAAVDAGCDTEDSRELTLWTLTGALVSPRIDVEGMRRLRSAVGEAHWNQIVAAYNDLKTGRVGPSADFLPSASSTRDPDEF